MLLFYFMLSKVYTCDVRNLIRVCSSLSLHKEAFDFFNKFQRKKITFKKPSLNKEVISNVVEYYRPYLKQKLSKFEQAYDIFTSSQSFEDYDRIEQKFKQLKKKSYYNFYSIVFYFVLKELKIKHLAEIKRFLFIYFDKTVINSFGFRKYIFFGREEGLEKIMQCFLHEYFSKDSILKVQDSDIRNACTMVQNGMSIIYYVKLFGLHKQKIDKIYGVPLQIQLRGYFPSVYKLLQNVREKDEHLYHDDFIILVNENIFSSKDFKNLVKFDKIFILLKITQRSLPYPVPTKATHYLLNIVLFNFKSIVYMLFGSEKMLFRQKYIPKYKLIILQNLKIKLMYFIYFSFTFESHELSCSIHLKSFECLLLCHFCCENKISIESSIKEIVENFKKTINILMEEHFK